MARALLLARAEEERLKRALVLYRRQLRAQSWPLDLPETAFMGHFRLSKGQFVELCDDIFPLMQQRRVSAVRSDLKILATLAFFANGSYQKDIGAYGYLGMAQSTMQECLHEVTAVLNTEDILKKYIKFPASRDERLQSMRRFYDRFAIPGTLGIADGTHVAIIRPREDEEAFFNRKMYHSLNVLIICNADLKILYADASFGGASHDSHVWNAGPVLPMMQRLHQRGEPCWLLGDSGYAQRPWMMVPILNAAPGTPEEQYTTMHTHARNAVERCIGVLKSRWRCLLAHRVLHYRPEFAAKMVNACIVLHNLINNNNFPLADDIDADRARQFEMPAAEEPINESGLQQRAALVTRLWNARHQN